MNLCRGDAECRRRDGLAGSQVPLAHLGEADTDDDRAVGLEDDHRRRAVEVLPAPVQVAAVEHEGDAHAVPPHAVGGRRYGAEGVPTGQLRRPLEHLAGEHRRAKPLPGADRPPGAVEGVHAAEVDGVHAEALGELVHRRLGRPRHLRRAEAAEGAAEQVVGVDDVGGDADGAGTW